MNSFQQLRIIFFALITGQIIYLLVAFILVSNNFNALIENYNSVFGAIITIIVLGFIGGSKLYYNQAVEKMRGFSLQQKISAYQTSSIIRFTLLEASNIICITFFLLTGDFLFIGMSFIVIGFFLINIPGRDKFISDFRLNADEINELK